MRIRILALISAAIMAISMPAAFSLHTLDNRISAAALASPGLLVIDPTDGRVLAANQPESMRIPASVMKLLTTTVALYQFSGDTRYVTAIWRTEKENEFLIRGSSDPFLTSSYATAKKFGARYLPSLVTKANPEGRRNIIIYYQGLFPGDITRLSSALKQKKVRATFIKVTRDTAEQIGTSEIAALTSKPLSEIVSHTILWSDNLIADRLSNQVLRALDEPISAKTRTAAYQEVLTTLGVYSDGIVARDGSGLSKKNRISARTVVELLSKIRNDQRFAAIYEGLPISGETGTLANRFDKAPLAIGHVHAKTGWVNNSVTMAGYVESGAKEYVFAILADGITPSFKARAAARRQMDKLLEVIVKDDH